MTKELKWREGDTCPACGAGQVWAGPSHPGPSGPVWIDGCAACQAMWERETRTKPTAEPCSNCAFLPNSRESRTGEIYGIISATIEGKGIFYCHRRVPFGVKATELLKAKADADGNVSLGGFQHQVNAAGNRITNAPVCAGWLKAKLREKGTQPRVGCPPAQG